MENIVKNSEKPFETLEDILKKIEVLERQLYATKVVQKEVSHYEIQQTYDYDPQTWIPYSDPYEISVKKIDIPEKIEPDNEKREEARKKLDDYFYNSPKYSVRYVSGKKLHYDISSKMNNWISSLEQKIFSSEEYCDIIYHEGLSRTKEYLEDAFKLYELSGSGKNLLKKIYDESRFVEFREEAGKKLGYTSLRIMFHEMFFKPKQRPQINLSKKLGIENLKPIKDTIRNDSSNDGDSICYEKLMPGADYDPKTWIIYGEGS